MVPPFVAIAVRPRPGVWEFVRVNVHELSVEQLTVPEYLCFKEALVDGEYVLLCFPVRIHYPVICFSFAGSCSGRFNLGSYPARGLALVVRRWGFSCQSGRGRVSLVLCCSICPPATGVSVMGYWAVNRGFGEGNVYSILFPELWLVD